MPRRSLDQMFDKCNKGHITLDGCLRAMTVCSTSISHHLARPDTIVVGLKEMPSHVLRRLGLPQAGAACFVVALHLVNGQAVREDAVLSRQGRHFLQLRIAVTSRKDVSDVRLCCLIRSDRVAEFVRPGQVCARHMSACSPSSRRSSSVSCCATSGRP